MKTYTLVMQIEADDEVNPDQIREEFYDAGGDVPFGFEITNIAETASTSARKVAEDAAVAKLRSIYSGQIPDSVAREIANAVLDATTEK